MDFIPEELLRGHEDREVVFFCGVGVSVPAGLPSFKKLVEDTLADLLPLKEQCEPGSTEALAWQAFEDKKYDEALGILESPQHGGYEAKDVREKVRRHLSEPRTKTLDKHLILTRLADLDTEHGRLVTTNFDELFERSQIKLRKLEQSSHRMDVHIAPTLPPAKPETFKGLVYLHGKLGSSPNNRQLVLTTANFGMAYMLEGWALRFVTELFRHYHVVFIGYSLEDPTMRYLVSALAAAREERSQQFKEPYVFAPYSSEETAGLDKVKQQWKLRGITPILYDKTNKHQQLWQALEKWADNYRQGITGRRQLVSHLSQLPPVSDENDSTIRDMAWALKDTNVARHFADLTGKRRPIPEWIMPLQKKGLLSLPIGQTDDGQPIFVPLVSSRQLADLFDLNEVTFHLGRWIAKCLDSQVVLDWALTEGAILHSELHHQIRTQLDENTTQLPPALHKIWRILADGSYAHMLSERYTNRSYRNFTHPSLGPDATFALQIFLNRLRPIPIFKARPDFLWRKQIPDPSRPRNWCEIEIELIGVNGDYEIQKFRNNAEDWSSALAVIAEELTTRLREAMGWFCEFGLAGPNEDITHIEYKSISPHEQNKHAHHAHTWTQLIALARDSYDALVAQEDHAAATHLVQRWRSLPYPVFRRLALYAATKNPRLDVEFGLDILLDRQQPALWDINIMREPLRFLRKRGHQFREEQLTQLTEAILEGPPRQMYQEDLTADEWNTVRDYQILLRLYKLKEAGVLLPVSVQKTYDRIQSSLSWQPKGDHSEEFSFFISSDTAALGPINESKLENFGEMSDEQFIQWSEKQQDEDILLWKRSGSWSQFVKNDTQAAVRLLKAASDNNVWPARPWYYVLYACGQEGQENVTDALKQVIAKLLVDMPIQTLGKLYLQAARWFEGVWRQLDEALRRKLWRRIWDASIEGEEPQHDLDFNMAHHHAGGILGNILYNELTKRIPSIASGQSPGFPKQLRRDFEYLTEHEEPSIKMARVRLAPMLFALYRIDPDLTKRTFFRRMDPEDKETFDPYLWEGYLWYAHCSADLLVAFKPLLFKILRHLDCIPEHSRDRAVTLFTYQAVPPDRGISTDEARGVLWILGPDKLVSVAASLRNMLQGAGEKSLALWRDTVEPWFNKVWPRRPSDKSPALSENLAWMAIDAGEAFPSIVNTIQDILTPENEGAALHFLSTEEQDTGLVSRYPQDSLSLIDQLVYDGRDHEILGGLLNTISAADPTLKETDSFNRLSKML